VVPSFYGRRVLIVEDEYLLAADLARYFKEMGAIVLGPAPSIDAAESEIGRADAAVLDIDLNGEKVFPVADKLASLGIPFVFFTGYSDIAIPSRFRHAGYFSKPVSFNAVLEALFPPQDKRTETGNAGSEDVLSLLPRLRLSARLMLGDASAADRLVEMMLERAIERVGSRAKDVTVEAWLSELLEDTRRRWGHTLLH
jgi:DNA-binding LytR/AlgR family response regulator